MMALTYLSTAHACIHTYSLVAEKYNDENKLRTVMSEEIWLGQLRQYRNERRIALQGVLQKIDRLS